MDNRSNWEIHYLYLSPTSSSDSRSASPWRILRGVKKPTDCKLFATSCTPDNPLGSCMVSDEGACAAYYTYGRFRQEALERRKRDQSE